jgi:hypothetical protein
VQITDPVLSFTPDEMGIFDREETEVSTSGLHGTCKVGYTYFMCSISVEGAWDPVDDFTPDVEQADVSSATLVVVAE